VTVIADCRFPIADLLRDSRIKAGGCGWSEKSAIGNRKLAIPVNEV